MHLVCALICCLVLLSCGGKSPTPTLQFQRHTAAQVLDAFTRAGLPAADAGPGKPWKTGDQWPNVAVERVVFTIPAIAPQGGVVQTFATPDDLAAMQAFYARVPDQAPYVFAHANALVQLDNGLPKAEALRYQAALATLP